MDSNRSLGSRRRMVPPRSNPARLGFPFQKRLADWQARLDETVFWNSEKFALHLRAIYDEHKAAASKLHCIIDGLKHEAMACPISTGAWTDILCRTTDLVALVLRFLFENVYIYLLYIVPLISILA